MTRNLPASVSSQVESDVTRWAVLLELDLDSEPVRVWSGVGTLSWGGKTWYGVGNMGSISGVSEATDMTDTLIEATLSSIPQDDLPNLVDEVTMNEPVGRPFELHLAFFDEDTSITDVVTLTAGFIDSVSLTDGETGTVKFQLASEAALLNRSTFFRLDDQHQQFLFAGDLGLEFVTRLDEQVSWGSGQTNSFPPRNDDGGGSVGGGGGSSIGPGRRIH